jgi:hypothetical protein
VNLCETEKLRLNKTINIISHLPLNQFTTRHLLRIRLGHCCNTWKFHRKARENGCAMWIKVYSCQKRLRKNASCISHLLLNQFTTRLFMQILSSNTCDSWKFHWNVQENGCAMWIKVFSCQKRLRKNATYISHLLLNQFTTRCLLRILLGHNYCAWKIYRNVQENGCGKWTCVIVGFKKLKNAIISITNLLVYQSTFWFLQQIRNAKKYLLTRFHENQ